MIVNELIRKIEILPFNCRVEFVVDGIAHPLTDMNLLISDGARVLYLDVQGDSSLLVLNHTAVPLGETLAAERGKQ